MNRTKINTTVPKWGICPHCGKERRVSYKIMTEHNRYDPSKNLMVYCLGSQEPPAEVTKYKQMYGDQSRVNEIRATTKRAG